MKANEGRYFCECGCGEVIPLLPSHFSEGIPRYRHGHNPNPHKKQLPPRQPCECGCGKAANHGKRFVSGHAGRGKRRSAEVRAKISASKMGERNPMYGKRSPRFIGRVMMSGYWARHLDDHPFGGKNHKVMEHRVVVENHLRESAPDSPYLIDVNGEKYLRPEIEVHHRNGIKTDNRIENLQTMRKAEHATHHQTAKRPELDRRNAAICALRDDGVAPSEIARRYGLTYQRVWQITSRC